jgi:hypothetical protein
MDAECSGLQGSSGQGDLRAIFECKRAGHRPARLSHQ